MKVVLKQLNLVQRSNFKFSLANNVGEWGSKPIPCPHFFHLNKTSGTYEYIQNFKPRDSDVIVTTYKKTGTNLLLQICHQLRTRGHTDFECIHQDNIAPWIDIAFLMNQNLDNEQITNPRLFKSHIEHSAFSGKGKIISTVRDPLSSFRSWKNFSPAHAKLTVDEVVQAETNSPLDNIYEQYVNQWMGYEKKIDNFMLVVYEDLIPDEKKRENIKRIAKFANYKNVDDELLDLVMKLSSKEEMMKMNDAFGSIPIFKRIEKHSKDPEWMAFLRQITGIDIFKVGNNSKMVTDGEHQKKNPSQECLQFMEDKWDKEVTQKIGFKNYQEMCDAIEEVNKSRY